MSLIEQEQKQHINLDISLIKKNKSDIEQLNIDNQPFNEIIINKNSDVELNDLKEKIDNVIVDINEGIVKNSKNENDELRTARNQMMEDMDKYLVTINQINEEL